MPCARRTIWILATCVALAAQAGDVRAGDAVPRPTPALAGSLDLPIAAAGAGLLAILPAIEIDRFTIPTGGLDPDAIHWELDRRALSGSDPRAEGWSDAAATIALAGPLALAYARGDRDVASLRPRVVLYAESVLLAEGIVQVTKRGISRPRPMLYREDVTPGRAEADAYLAFPSSHAALAFCGAGFACADHLRSRPGAGWKEHALVGLASGVTATATAALRVEAGQHFPSDILGGAAIGLACGTGLPFLHAYRADGGEESWSTPSAEDVLGTAGGFLLGSALVVAVASAN